jgi:radical SAM superfamily enzyme YgiQ (UPF0313 family)
MRIALINAPVAKPSPHARLAPPLGLAYIGAVLLEEGHEVSAVDFNLSGLSLRRVENLVQWERPGLVGISAQTETYPNALEIARKAKEVDPGVKVVLGGPHASIMPEEVLAQDAVDFVVVGEGEATTADLARYLGGGGGDLGAIKGLGYKDGGRLRINERRELLDPDSLPWPARDLFPLEFYKDRWNVLTARGGCPFQCPFCSASFIWQGRRRARAPERIVDELRTLVEEHGADYIFFSDDILTLNRKWVYDLLGLLGQLPYSLEWGCATRVDVVDRRLLEDMAKAGCRAIQFGIESGSQEILDSVKHIKKEQAVEAVQAAVEVGIDVACSFMMPFPEDTRETIRETAEFMQRLYHLGGKILLAYTTPYPGTYFYQHAGELGLKILTDRWEEFDAKHNVLETRHLTAQEIEELVEEVARDIGLRRSVS